MFEERLQLIQKVVGSVPKWSCHFAKWPLGRAVRFEQDDDKGGLAKKGLGLWAADTEAHAAPAQLVASGRIRAIVTTNFDALIERAPDDEGASAQAIATSAA